jgi:hypothetical protein
MKKIVYIMVIILSFISVCLAYTSWQGMFSVGNVSIVSTTQGSLCEFVASGADSYVFLVTNIQGQEMMALLRTARQINKGIYISFDPNVTISYQRSGDVRLLTKILVNGIGLAQ